MEEGVAGPEIKTIKEHQFMTKKNKSNPNHAAKKKTNQNTEMNSDKLCCVTEKKNSQVRIYLTPQTQDDTGTHRRHVDIMWVNWAVVSTGSRFGSLCFSCHRKRSYRFSDRTSTLKQKLHVFLASKCY